MAHMQLSNITEGQNEIAYDAVGDATNLPQESTRIQAHDKAIKKAEEKRMVARTISLLNHMLIAGVTIYIIVISFQTSSLFSWHPSCMTVGTFLLMAEAVMAMSPDNILTFKLEWQTRVRIHWILQAVAAALIFIGFLTIVINKNLHNRNHFYSVHAIFGLITVILVCLTSLGGVFALFSLRFRQLIRPVTIKLMHNILGIITYFIGAVCFILGLYTHWFESFGYYARIICRILVIFSVLTTLESPTKSAYYRIKNILSRT